MIVCHCEVVSDRDVRAHIDAGARDLSALTAGCGVAANCAGCVPALEDLLDEAALAIRDTRAVRRRQADRRVVVAA